MRLAGLCACMRVYVNYWALIMRLFVFCECKCVCVCVLLCSGRTVSVEIINVMRKESKK